MNLRPIVAAALVAALSPAHAVVGAGQATLCSDSLIPWLNDGYVECTGPLAGAVGPGQIDSVFFSAYGSFRLAGLSDDASGAFAANPGAVDFGTLALSSVQRGAFVIGVQGGGSYSLYLFDGSRIGSPSLTFDTFGVVDGAGTPGPSLTHAALYVPGVPEPATAALFAAGLGAVALLRRRRAA